MERTESKLYFVFKKSSCFINESYFILNIILQRKCYLTNLKNNFLRRQFLVSESFVETVYLMRIKEKTGCLILLAPDECEIRNLIFELTGQKTKARNSSLLFLCFQMKNNWDSASIIIKYVLRYDKSALKGNNAPIRLHLLQQTKFHHFFQQQNPSNRFNINYLFCYLLLI